MRFNDSIEPHSLATLVALQSKLQTAQEAFLDVDNQVIGLQRSTEVKSRTQNTNGALLGQPMTSKTINVRPAVFYEKHSALLEQHEALKIEIEQIFGQIGDLKKQILEDVAEKAVVAYEAAAEKLADAHALLYSLGKREQKINTMVWREIAIPASVQYGRLQQRADKPHGRASLYYTHKADMLCAKYDSEVAAFLNNKTFSLDLQA
jgi:hypothetical protein